MNSLIIIDLDKLREQIRLSHSETIKDNLTFCVTRSKVEDLKNHDTKIIANERKELIGIAKDIIQNYHAYIDDDVIALIQKDLERLKEKSDDYRNA